jgi:hypothetical protein
LGDVFIVLAAVYRFFFASSDRYRLGGGLSWDELDDGDTFPMAERKPPER